MSSAEKEFKKLTEDNRELIQQHIRINNDYHQAHYDALEAKEKYDKSLGDPIIQRYEELLDMIEEEEK